LARRKTYYLLQVHKITGRTERSFPKAQVLSYQKESMSLNLQHYPYTIFGIRTLIGSREHLETIEQET
jgi:hypothetical protein